MHTSSLVQSATETSAGNSATLTRREAIRRAALFLGVALSPSLITGVLQAQTAAPAGAGAKPVYFTPQQFETVAAIAERILPRTDTPGALDVGVPAFIDLMYGKYLTADEKKTIAAGLADVDAQSVATHKTAFAKLAAAQQEALLTRVAEAAQNKEKTFFHQIKELTVVGYFTSETVGKTVLNYDPVPGRLDACIPLAQVGNRAWTK
jgi:hypothetical protein